MSDTDTGKTRPVAEDPKTGTTLSQLVKSMESVQQMERLRVIGILRRYPARSAETRDALWTIEREILRGKQ